MRRARKKSREGVSYWQSYSDMMAAILLMFVLIMAFTLLQSLKYYQEMTQNIERAKIEYEESQKKLEEQTELVEEQQKLLEEQQEQLEKLIGVKSELVEAINKEFENTDMAIQVDPQTGSIVLDSNVLFDFGKHELKPEAKKFLKNFIPKYLNVLMSEEFKEYIGEIIIEGYTDNVGDFISNLDLSQKRAFSIAEYCLDSRNEILDKNGLERLKEVLTANGKSQNNLIYDENGKVDADASRRVEFKFQLKDEEMIETMQKLLGE